MPNIQDFAQYLPLENEYQALWHPGISGRSEKEVERRQKEETTFYTQ